MSGDGPDGQDRAGLDGMPGETAQQYSMANSSIAVSIGIEGLDWPVVCGIFEWAPLGKRDPDQLRRAAERSHVVCSAWDGETMVGFGRAISDGGSSSASRYPVS